MNVVAMCFITLAPMPMYISIMLLEILVMATKASTAIRKASELQNRIEVLLAPINEKLVEVLGDENAHIVYQSGDGWCVCHNDGDNAAIVFLDIDKVLQMDSAECLAALRSAGI